MCGLNNKILLSDYYNYIANIYSNSIGILRFTKTSTNLFFTLTTLDGRLLASSSLGAVNLYGNQRRVKLSYNARGLLFDRILKSCTDLKLKYIILEFTPVTIRYRGIIQRKVRYNARLKILGIVFKANIPFGIPNRSSKIRRRKSLNGRELW